MIRKLAPFALALLLLAGTAVMGTAPEQSWQWQRQIQTDDAQRFNQFEISPEIYAKSQFGLGDLRIVDDKGGPAPYILSGQRTTYREMQDAAAFTQDRTFRKNNDTFFDFTGEVPAGTDLILNQLTAGIGYSGDFFKYVELYGSYDSTHWEWIGNDSFYRVQGSIDDVIPLNGTEKYTSYRIVILDNIENISLTDLTGTLITASEKLSERTIILGSGQYVRSEDKTATRITIKGYRNLPVQSLSIDADGLFHRPCRVISGNDDATADVFASGWLYQSTLKGSQPLKNNLPVAIGQPYDTLTLIIENGDNPPLTIQNITLEYTAETLVFEPAKGKSYSLHYGNTEALRPQYDLEQFKNEIAQQSIGTAQLSAESGITAPTKSLPASLVSQKTIFSIVIFAVALLMGWFAVRGMRKNGS